MYITLDWFALQWDLAQVNLENPDSRMVMERAAHTIHTFDLIEQNMASKRKMRDSMRTYVCFLLYFFMALARRLNNTTPYKHRFDKVP